MSNSINLFLTQLIAVSLTTEVKFPFLAFLHFNLAAAKHSCSPHNQAAVLSRQSVCTGGSMEHSIFVFPLETAAVQSH